MFIFLFPVYLIWAFCELFTGAINENKEDLSVNVNITRGTVDIDGGDRAPKPMPRETRTSADKRIAIDKMTKNVE